MSNSGRPPFKTRGPHVERPVIPAILVVFNKCFKLAGPLFPFALLALRVLLSIAADTRRLHSEVDRSVPLIGSGFAATGQGRRVDG